MAERAEVGQDHAGRARESLAPVAEAQVARAVAEVAEAAVQVRAESLLPLRLRLGRGWIARRSLTRVNIPARGLPCGTLFPGVAAPF